MSFGNIPPIGIPKGNPFSMTAGGITAPMQMEPMSDVKRPSFKDMVSNAVGNVNETLSAPDTLMQRAMTTGDVDIHDVMIANAKAELAVNVTSQIATKVMQAYDRILQIQI